MNKYSSKIFLSILATLTILLSGCRSDEFRWNGQEIAEDEYLIAFLPQAQTVERVSRASEADLEEIKSLSLLIFDGDNNLVRGLHFPEDAAITAPSQGHAGSVTVKKNKLATGKWLLVANAADKVKAAIGDFGEDAIPYSTLLEKITFDNKQFDSEQRVFTSEMEVKDLKEAQESAVLFPLDRIFSRVSVESNLKEMNFILTGSQLSRQGIKRSLGASNPEINVYSNDEEAWTKNNTGVASDINDNEVEYAPNGTRQVTPTFPMASPENDPVFLIIRGRYEAVANNQEGKAAMNAFSDKECYYAVTLPDLKANHYYRVVINGVPAAGASSIEEAIDHPNRLSIRFTDETDEIKNMVSDGENVLAVCDTIFFEANETTPKLLDVKVRYNKKSGNDSPEVSFEQAGANGWVTIDRGSGVWTDIDPSADESQNGLLTNRRSFKVSVPENKGTERSERIKVKLAGTELEREVVILQRAPGALKFADAGIFLSLTVKPDGESETTFDDYMKFIRSQNLAVSDNNKECYGTIPEENGGQVRNKGIHMPMPNGGVTYTYTLKVPANATVAWGTQMQKVSKTETTSGNQKLYTFSFKDGDNYDYAVYGEEVSITINGAAYNLDLYHTGFFDNKSVSGKWLYYEVFTGGTGSLHWLDRNMGATSAGMGVRTGGSSVLSDSQWPIVGDKAMGEYYSSEDGAKCPRGWRFPTYAEMEVLTSQARFSTTRMSTYTNKTPFYAPHYDFTGNVKGVTTSLRSYFPQNMKMVDGSVSGDAQAGYYLTTTTASVAGWYQTMQLSGMNASPQNTQMTTGDNKAVKTRMSVRCVAGSYDSSLTATYACQVKGYTHVFLYYLNADGTKTYLTTWPGEQVAVASDVNRFHPFEYSSLVPYPDDRIYVIFNKVENGRRTASNVSEENVNKRQGIRFKNQDATGIYAYDINNTPVAAGAIRGNWLAPEEGPIELPKKVLIFRAPVSDLGYNQKYLYIWGGREYLGEYSSSPECRFAENGAYAYWTSEYAEDEQISITGYIFKTGANSDTNRTDINHTNFVVEETDPAILSIYNADKLYTLGRTKVPVPEEPEPADGLYDLGGDLIVMYWSSSSGKNKIYMWQDKNDSNKPFGGWSGTTADGLGSYYIVNKNKNDFNPELKLDDQYLYILNGNGQTASLSFGRSMVKSKKRNAIPSDVENYLNNRNITSIKYILELSQ